MSADATFNNANSLMGFPNEFATDEIKSQQEYGIAYFRAMWNSVNYRGAFNERRARFFKLRAWAEGLQNIDDLKPQMGINGDTSFANIDYKPISILPKYVDSMVGLLLNQQFQVQCAAIDPFSKSQKDEKKAQMEADILFKKFSDKLKEKTGVGLMSEEYASKMLKTQEEIDLYMDLTFKLATEVSVELGLEWIFYNNRMEEIKKGLIKDLVTMKWAATYTYYDRNNKICIDRVLPEWMVTPYSNYDDHRNISYGGFVKMMRIQDIKKEAGNQFTEEEYFEIAQQNAGRNNNPSWDTRFTTYPATALQMKWYNYLIPVLVGEFVSSEYKGYETFVNKEGMKRVTKAIREKDDVDQYYFDIANKYQGKWIINTNYIYDYGKARNMVRERIGNTYSLDVPLGLNVYAVDIFDGENKSHVERAIHSIQQMQLAEGKIQQMLAKARPKGYAVNVAGLVDVDLGQGQNMTPLELQTIYDQTGVLYYSAVNEDGTPNNTPITPMENGLDFEGIRAMIMVYNMHLQMLSDLTGINSSTDASTVSTESAVGVQKMQAQATINTLRPLKSAYLDIIQRTAKLATMMLQDVCRYGNGIEGVLPAIGERPAQIIKLGADVSLADIGIKIEMLPTDEEKAIIYTAIDESVRAGLIKPSDGVFCKTIPNLKQMRLYLKYQEQKYREEKMQEAQANAQQSAQANAQAGVAVEQAAQQTVQIKGQQEAQVLTVKYDLEEQKAAKDFERKVQEMALQHQYTMQEIALNGENSKKNQSSDLIK